MTLGQKIQQIRTAHGLSQEEFAAKLGTTRQTVSRWELDQTYPEIAKIVLISKIFSVSTDSILRDGISTLLMLGILPAECIAALIVRLLRPRNSHLYFIALPIKIFWAQNYIRALKTKKG